MTGVQHGSKGVSISEEGEFLDIGTVFYSKDAAANILSFASQVDAGANIQYNGAYVPQTATTCISSREGT
jgi:hypothetical protein